MNVTKDNFKEVAEQIEALLPTAAFVSFDEEMTGVSIAGQSDRIEDTPAERYSKMRNVASRYAIIQFGLAIFHKKQCDAGGDCETYEAHAYNFYVFPESGPVNMDASGIHFNSNHGMDWNKWMREGIPFVNQEAAKKLKETICPDDANPGVQKKDETKVATRSPMTLTKDADIETTKSAIAALRAWLADDAKREETEFEVITTNAYLRRFMHETLAADFPTLTVESRPTATRGISTMFALRLTEAQQSERAAKIRQEKEAEFERKLGFTKIFNALAKARKPVVGHAVMYDLLFALSHFQGLLPESYSKFKELVQDLFPLLFDTQLLVKSEPFKYKPQPKDADPGSNKIHRFGSMALGQVFKVFEDEAVAARAAGKGRIEIKLAEGHDRYGPDKAAAFHEAGYDAYITGCVFANMAKETLGSENVSKFNGRSTMFRALFHFNLSGDDELISKGVYVHARGLKGWSADAFKNALAEIKAPRKENDDTAEAGEMEIRWLDDDSAFAVFPETCREAVAKMLGRDGSSPGDAGKLQLTSWDDWLSARSAATATASSMDETSRKRSSAAPATTTDVTEPPCKRQRLSESQA
eukprot:TRINITY_DN41328_c0_g1_i1.p1 TRINITY_DN41328_c0_g1~~TRINITY_DN41328_c0_g1_i1.p1  ORF type:complete len:605 (+),score=133.46 TRINITY_DN41328_c0_g1_i1:63-1817(+)